MKKRILSLLLLLAVCFSCLPAYAADLSIVTEETLIEGVTYRNMKKLFDNGWQDIHIVTADLNEKHLNFDVLSSQSGKSYLENTYESAKAADAIAAVNADFFAKSGESGRGSGIGLEITDGVIRTSPAAYEQMNVLYEVEKTGKFLFDMFSYEFTVTAPDKESAPISVINKYDSMTGIVLYTPDWGEMTPGSAGNVLEVVVEDDVVTAKNRDIGPVAIPKDGYVLACDLSMHTFLDDHLQVEDEIQLSIATTPNFETIKTAVGGGGLLLIDGQVQTEYSHSVSGTHPRTAVGIDKTGKIITLVVVDGRRTNASGMTMPQLGQLMKDLGCHNAMNLDGGGSSLMALKQDGTQQVVNTPSDGGKRAVTNSIGILADTEKSVATHLVLTSDTETVFAGTSTFLYAKILDQYRAFMENADVTKIQFSTQNGAVDKGFFFPEKSGTATITANYGNLSGSINLTVLDAPHRMAFSLDKQALAIGEKRTLWLTAWDKNGVSAPVYPADVKVTVENPAIATVSGNTLTAHATGSTVVSATFGGTTAYTVVTVGDAEAVSALKNISLPDPMAQAGAVTDSDGFQFTVFGNTRTPVVLFDLYMMNGVKNAVKKASDMNFFVGNEVDASLLTDLGESAILADGYSQFTKNGSTFITLKNAYGKTLYSSDTQQMKKLQSAVNNFSGGNLFVFLNDHNISYYDTELTVFKNLMAEAAKKADNVYVFGGGFVNECVMEDGVRYVTTAGVFPSIGLKSPATNISYVKYYLITVNGDKVTYETKGILK